MLVNSSTTINGTSIALGASGTVTAANPNALTISTGLTGGSYTGASAVTIAIDTSVVTTLTGTQTLTNKTLTSPVISTITNTGTLTLPTSTDTLVGKATTDTLTNKSISGSTNTLTNIGNSALTNSTVTIGSTSVALGATVTTFAGVTLTSPTFTTPALGTPSSGVLTNATGYTTANLVGTISNAQLANSTISGVSLGSNLANLTAGTNITFSTGTTYNGSAAITINATGAAQVYPAAGIANSTGTAWGTSYSTTGSGTVVALATSPTFVTPILGTPTSGTLTNTTGFPAANLAGTALPSAIVTSSLTSVGTIGTGVWNGTAIGIAYGGTGQTTASAGFNALSPITTTGDLILGNGTNSATRLGIGTNGYVLTVSGGTAVWAAAAGGGSQATPTTLGTVYGLTSLAGPYTVALGYGTASVNTGTFNTIIGHSAGSANTTGTGITAVGAYTLTFNTTGKSNVAVGGYDGATGVYPALRNNTTGSNNTAVGVGTLKDSTTGDSNTAIGYLALFLNTTASNNTAVGYQALRSNTTGANNVSVGYQALYSQTGSVDANVGVGQSAGYSNSSGYNNTFLGTESGYLQTGGNFSTYIGYRARGSTTTDSDCLVVSGGYNGGGAVGKGSSTAFITGNGGGTYNGSNSSSWATTSDQRLKKNIVDNTVGLESINAICVRNFEYRLPEEITELSPLDAIKKEGVQLGVIAQELKAILPDCVKEESTGVLSVDTSNLTWHMINAIKELSAKIIALETKLGV
jgi:hypothetical protein